MVGPQFVPVTVTPQASVLGQVSHSPQSCDPEVGSGKAQRSLSVGYTGELDSRVGPRGQILGYSLMVGTSI